MQPPEMVIETLYETCTETDKLEHLAQVAGLDPSVDFEQADLRGLNAREEDLTRFSFRGADLRESDLSYVRLRRGALKGAMLDGARLEGITWDGPFEVDRYIFDWGKAWSEISTASLAELISKVAPVDGKYKMDQETTRGFHRDLSFYKSVKLLAFVDQNWTNRNLVIYYLEDQGNLFRLNGTSPAVHEVNAKAPVQVNESNVIDYLRFFMFMVRGEEGPFRLLEEYDESELSGELDETTRSVIDGIKRSATLEGLNERGHFLVDAPVLYSDGIFMADFAVQPTGMVEMLDDEPIATDLPVKWNLPVA